MPTLSIKQTTKLGQVLEMCVAPMIEACGYKYENSKQYAELLTRPDFLLYDSNNDNKVIVSVAVTATTNSQAWIKKRWRYIDEVWQLKSHYGPDLLSINLVIADPSVFQQSEMLVMDAFFDRTILASTMPGGQDTINDVIRELRQNDHRSSEEIAQAVIGRPEWVKLKLSITHDLNAAIDNRSRLVEGSKFRRIWEQEHHRFSGLYEKVTTQNYYSGISYLRYTALNGLLIGKETMGILCNSIIQDTSVPDSVVEECKNTEFSFVRRIGSYHISDDKLRATVLAGFSQKTYESIEASLLVNDTQRYLLRDIQKHELLMRMVSVVLPTITNQSAIASTLHDAFRSNEYMGIDHVRVWPLDVYIAYLETSALGINRLFTERFGHVGVANPINNYILKTAFARSRFSKEEDLRDFCVKLSSVLFELLSQTPSKDNQKVYDVLKQSKLDALKLQPYINPLQRYLEGVLSDHGYTYEKAPISCILGEIDGIPGRMKHIEEVYQAHKNDITLWIKCIAGYEGGVDHKTQEMAARGRLLQYAPHSNTKRGEQLVFVFDGKWSIPLQKSLALGGWDPIIPIFEFSKYLESLHS